MLAYILIFIISTFTASKITNKKNKKNIFLLTIIILLISIIGGLRDFNIGTDVEVYGKNWFEIASKSSNFKNYINSINSSEYGYLFINYIISRFTSNTNFFLFSLQIICNTLVYITLFKNRDKCPIWMSSLIYLCVFYGMSFNIMRQACALSIIFYGVNFLKNNDNKKYLLFILLATLFHSTAPIAGIIIFLICKLSNSKSKFRFIIFTLMLFITIVGLIFIKDIIEIGYNLGIVSPRIYNYLDVFVKNEVSVSIVDLTFKLFILGICLLRIKFVNKQSSINKFLLICTITDFILYQTKIFISYSERFSFYFGYISIIYIPQAFNSLSTQKNDKIIYNIIFSIIMLGYWYYKYVKIGICEIYPYSSHILGI